MRCAGEKLIASLSSRLLISVRVISDAKFTHRLSIDTKRATLCDSFAFFCVFLCDFSFVVCIVSCIVYSVVNIVISKVIRDTVM